VAPQKKGYLELDPEKSRKLLGELQDKLEEKSSTVEKKELLGKEVLDGHMCEKVHVVMTLHNGTKTDTTAWLSEQLDGFPLKTITDFRTPRGITGTNTIQFTNLEKTVPDAGLFEIPKGYTEYDTFLELATEGKLGSRIKKRKGRGKLFKRK